MRAARRTPRDPLTSSPASPSSPSRGHLRLPAQVRFMNERFQQFRQRARDSIFDLVPMVAVLAEERALEDLVFLDIDPELQIPLAHGAAQDLHEVSLHPSREREHPT